MTAVTLNGHSYSDDGSQSRDMRFGGHQSWLLPMLQDTMTEVDAANNAAISADASAIAAAASATSAANYAAALKGTSATSLSITVSSKSLTTQTGKQFVAGQYVLLVDHVTPAQWMLGSVTSYNAGTGALVVNVEDAAGTGTIALWDILLSGKRGATGSTGLPGAVSIPYAAKTGAYTAVAADKGKLIDCTSGTWALGYQAPATLGADWFIYVRNSGTGDITHTPASGTIDGLSSFIGYPGSVRLVVCDGTALRSIPLVGGIKSYTSTPGSNYIVPPGVMLRLIGIGGGAGGQSGTGNCATTGAGGRGGGGGGFREAKFKLTAGTSVAVAIGAGGAGGAGTSDGVQQHGSPGGDTTFGAYFSAYRGMGSATTGAPGGGDYYAAGDSGGSLSSNGRGDLSGSSGGVGGTSTNGSGAPASVRGGGGGGGGGGLSGSRSGGYGGKSGQYSGADPGGVAGGTGGTTGGAGTAGGAVSDLVSGIGAGGGGGGGGTGTAGAGGAGGAGGTPGGGGGGGGAGFTAFIGGSGGAGGRGELWVMEEI